MMIGLQGILFVIFVFVHEGHSEKSASPTNLETDRVSSGAECPGDCKWFYPEDLVFSDEEVCFNTTSTSCYELPENGPVDDLPKGKYGLCEGPDKVQCKPRSGEPCDDDSFCNYDSASGEICSSGVCNCGSAAPCPLGQICKAGACECWNEAGDVYCDDFKNDGTCTDYRHLKKYCAKSCGFCGTPQKGDYCLGYDVAACEEGLICEDPKKPGTNVNSCGANSCQCVEEV